MNDYQQKAIEKTMPTLFKVLEKRLFASYLTSYGFLNLNQMKWINKSGLANDDLIVNIFTIVKLKKGSWELVMKYLEEHRYGWVVDKLMAEAEMYAASDNSSRHTVEVQRDSAALVREPKLFDSQSTLPWSRDMKSVMNEFQWKAIETMKSTLSEVLRNTLFVDYLRGHGLLSENECELVDELVLTTGKISQIFNLVKWKEGSWVLVVRYLEEHRYRWLVDKLMTEARWYAATGDAQQHISEVQDGSLEAVSYGASMPTESQILVRVAKMFDFDPTLERSINNASQMKDYQRMAIETAMPTLVEHLTFEWTVFWEYVMRNGFLHENECELESRYNKCNVLKILNVVKWKDGSWELVIQYLEVHHLRWLKTELVNAASVYGGPDDGEQHTIEVESNDPPSEQFERPKSTTSQTTFRSTLVHTTKQHMPDASYNPALYQCSTSSINQQHVDEYSRQSPISMKDKIKAIDAQWQLLCEVLQTCIGHLLSYLLQTRLIDINNQHEITNPKNNPNQQVILLLELLKHQDRGWDDLIDFLLSNDYKWLADDLRSEATYRLMRCNQ